MRVFQSKKTKTEYVGIGAVKDWRDSDLEIEYIGQKLDQAREILKSSRSAWAKQYWSVTVNNLLKKWTMMLKLKDTGLRQSGPQNIFSKVQYDWWEGTQEVGGIVGLRIFDLWFDNVGLDSRLDESWAKSKEQKLEKARLGLA